MTCDVLVLPHKRVRGWRGDRAELGRSVQTFPVVTLKQALRSQYQTDAHFCPYYVVRKGQVIRRIPRMNREGLTAVVENGDQLLFSAVVIDVDDVVAHAESRDSGQSIGAREEWRHEQDDLYGNLPQSLLSGMGRYDTRGGYRLLWELDPHLEPKDYLDFVAALRRELRRNGIHADELRDWQRLYRLPFVNRDGKNQRLDAELDGLGPIRWTPTEDPHDVFDGIEDVRTSPGQNPGEKITENRNTSLTSLAGGLRRRGYEFPVLLGMLRVINEQQVEPPLDADEVESIARSVCRYDPPPPTDEDNPGGNGDFRFTLGDEVEIARIACEDIESGVAIVCDRSKLWQYSETLGVWQELEPHRIDRVIHTYSGEPVLRGLDRNGQPKVTPLRISNRLCRGVADVIAAQKRQPEFFDEARDGLVFRNGFVRASATGVETLEHSPEHRQVAYLPFDFVPGAKPVGFIKALRSCWRDDEDLDREQKIQLLREWIGAAICNRATQYQKGLILHGGGANGKSTIQEIVMAMFPAGTVTSIAPQDMENEYRRAKLSTSRLNCVAELPEADILQSEAVKAMIGGDLISARYIREAVFEYQPRAAHLFSANTLPGVRDMTAGFWRRWIVLTFDRQFEESEMERGLAGRIISTELAQIASWAVEGASELAARGHFVSPKSSEEAVRLWRQQADQVASFLDQRCKVDDTYEEYASTLYQSYSEWAGSNGHRRMSSVNFGKRLKALGVKKGRRRDGIVYGVEITDVAALVI